jgi:pyruvate,water dikinase
MADPMPPLALDLWAGVYGDLLNQFVAGDYDWVVCSDGRAYLDVTPFLKFEFVQNGFVRTVASVNEAAAAGTAALLEARADEFDTRPTLAGVSRTVRSSVVVLPAVARTLPGMVREGVLPFLRGAVGTDEYRDWFHRWGRRVESSILDTHDPDTLVESVFSGLPPRAVFEVTPKAMRLIVAPVTERVLEWVVPSVDSELIAATTRGSANEVGTRMILGLSDLADRARAQPELAAAVRAGRSADTLRSVEGGEQFCSEFEAFLDEFGHRTAGEFDPSRPRWRDDPAIPLALVSSRLDGAESDAPREQLRTRRRAAQEAIDEILTRAGQGTLGAIRQPLVAHLLRTYRSHVQLRDEPKHGSAHLFAAWHEALQRVGESLVDEEALANANDVWYLRRDELDALVADPGHPVPDIDARRRRHEQNKRVDAPPLLTSEGEAPRLRVRDTGPNVLVGTGVSAGVVEGRARVVRELMGVSLEAGDVLVCASSDPAWTPLFATASALVTEVGGRLTHGALVAREYGLPAVASVPGATTRITDGQRVRVDGDTGTVELLTAE